MPVATVLTACGIETVTPKLISAVLVSEVATVLTACGIETLPNVQQNVDEPLRSCNSTYRLRYATKGASRGAKRR